jgi:hypothetical protein
LPVDEAVDYLIQSARGLEAAHEKGIVHRDMKPGNLMLDRRGTVRVLDLGLARIVGAGNAFDSSAANRLTQTGMYMGTVDYMAPEQAEDSHGVDHRADIYSLGCTFHFLLTGREPFPGPTALKRMVAHQEHPAPSLRAARPEVSPGLEAAYQKMMAKSPEDRPPSMGAVIALLQASRPSSDDGGPPALAEPRLAQEAPQRRPLERVAASRKTIDSAILVRRMEDEDALGGRELNLRDLVMDVRSDVHEPGEAGTDRDESKDACDVRELRLSELAQELGEGAPRASVPRPPIAPAPPLRRIAAPQQDVTPPGVQIPCAAARPLERAPGLRREGTPPAAPKPSDPDALPPKRPAAPRRQGASPAASDPPAAEKPPPKPAEVPRPDNAPRAAPRPPAAERPSHKPASSMRPGDSAPNRGVAILAIAAAVLIVMAIVASMTHRPTVAVNNERNGPALDSVEGGSPPDGAPAPPANPEP